MREIVAEYVKIPGFLRKRIYKRKKVMLKTILCFFVCLYVITVSAHAELTSQDLDKIRLIIHEANAPIKAEIVSVKEELLKEIGSTKNEVSEVRGRLDGLEKMMTWLMVLIGVVVGIPQIIMAWRSKKDRVQEEHIQELRREVETLKQQRVVNH